MNTYHASRPRRLLGACYARLLEGRGALAGPWLAVDDELLYTKGRSIRLSEVKRVLSQRKPSCPGRALFGLALAILTVWIDPSNPALIAAGAVFVLGALIEGSTVTTAVVHTTEGDTLSYAVWGRCPELERFALCCYDAAIAARWHAMSIAEEPHGEEYVSEYETNPQAADDFLEQVRGQIDYWGVFSGNLCASRPTSERLEGLARGILTAIDQGDLALVPTDLLRDTDLRDADISGELNDHLFDRERRSTD